MMRGMISWTSTQYLHATSTSTANATTTITMTTSVTSTYKAEDIAVKIWGNVEEKVKLNQESTKYTQTVKGAYGLYLWKGLPYQVKTSRVSEGRCSTEQKTTYTKVCY